MTFFVGNEILGRNEFISTNFTDEHKHFLTRVQGIVLVHVVTFTELKSSKVNIKTTTT